VASSEIEGDAPTGTLTSPEFKIARKYVSFRIGGGDCERDTCINLLVSGRVVRSATGWRSDHLVPASWDVSRFLGQNAKCKSWMQRVVIGGTSTWIKSFRPINQSGYRKQPSRFTGRLCALNFTSTARQWTMDRFNPGMKQEGWLNDLNGLIYYEGSYHLFAQRWAKCWLHAVSRDLIHWTELEPAFWEEKLDSGVQSGTCVVDYNNTSGLSPDKATPPMVAFWSRFDNRTQCLCYSLDRGRTWKHYERNPIMVRPERDPKVFWYAPSNHWVMMLYGDSQYHILTSTKFVELEG